MTERQRILDTIEACDRVLDGSKKMVTQAIASIQDASITRQILVALLDSFPEPEHPADG